MVPTFTKVYADCMTRGRLLKAPVAVALLYLHAHLLRSSHHSNSNKRLYGSATPEAPDIISRCFTLTFLLRAPPNGHPSLCHLLTAGRVAAAGNTRQTFPYLKRGFILVTNRLMGLRAFQKQTGPQSGRYHSRGRESLGLFTVRSFFFYRKASVRTLSFRI